jgi:hypothetical protein
VSANINELLSLTHDLEKMTEETSDSDGAKRIVTDPENVERGLAQLVLIIVDLLRQLMERQAIRRMDSGTLTEEQIDRLGETFMKLEIRMNELKEHFGLTDEDLNLDLGPLGKLL